MQAHNLNPILNLPAYSRVIRPATPGCTLLSAFSKSTFTRCNPLAGSTTGETKSILPWRAMVPVPPSSSSFAG